MTRVNTSFNSINDFILNALIKISNRIWCQFKSGVCKSSWRNRLARSTVNREVVGSIPTEDDHFIPLGGGVLSPSLVALNKSILYDLLS